jgi:hypothetical protein
MSVKRPASVMIGTSAAMSYLDTELGDELEPPLGEEHVRPRVAVTAVAPHGTAEAEQVVGTADLVPLRERWKLTLESATVATLETPRRSIPAGNVRPGAEARGRPPAPPERGLARDAHAGTPSTARAMRVVHIGMPLR